MARPAAERSKARADREGQREQPVDIDADRFRHAPVVHRGADLRADIRALECIPEHGNERGAKHDQKCAVAREMAKPEIDLALQPIRQRRPISG